MICVVVFVLLYLCCVVVLCLCYCRDENDGWWGGEEPTRRRTVWRGRWLASCCLVPSCPSEIRTCPAGITTEILLRHATPRHAGQVRSGPWRGSTGSTKKPNKRATHYHSLAAPEHDHPRHTARERERERFDIDFQHNHHHHPPPPPPPPPF